MEWTQDQRDDIVNQAMDLCANIDNFRQVIILTMTNEGMMNVIQKRRDDATTIEALGMYRLMTVDTEQTMLDHWRDNERPCRDEED